MKASKIKGSKLRKFEGSEVLFRAVLRMAHENSLEFADRNEEDGTITFDIKQYEAFMEIIKEEVDEALAQALEQAKD